MEIKCYNTSYSTFGRDSKGNYKEYVSEEEYLEDLEDEESFTSLFHQAINELLEDEARRISKAAN